LNVYSVKLDFSGNRDAGAPYSSIKLIETIFGQTESDGRISLIQYICIHAYKLARLK